MYRKYLDYLQADTRDNLYHKRSFVILPRLWGAPHALYDALRDSSVLRTSE